MLRTPGASRRSAPRLDSLRVIVPGLLPSSADVGMCPVGGAVVAALVGGHDRAHEVQVLRDRLPPRLGKPLGGCAALFDVVIDRHPYNHPLRPLCDVRFARMDLGATPDGPSVLAIDGKRDSVAKVHELLKLKAQLLEGVPIA